MEMKQIILPVTTQTQASPQPQAGQENVKDGTKSAFASLLELVAGTETLDGEEGGDASMTDGSVESPQVKGDPAENLLNVMVGLLHLPKADELPELTGVADSQEDAVAPLAVQQLINEMPIIPVVAPTLPESTPLPESAPENVLPITMTEVPASAQVAAPVDQLPHPLDGGLLVPLKSRPQEAKSVPPAVVLAEAPQERSNAGAEIPQARGIETSVAAREQESPAPQLKVVKGSSAETRSPQVPLTKEAPQIPVADELVAEGNESKIEVVFRDAKHGAAQNHNGEQGLEQGLGKSKVNTLTNDFAPLVNSLESDLRPETKPTLETPKNGSIHDSIMDQVKQGIALQGNREKGEVSIRLNPAELGELKINVRMEDQKLKVDVITENPVVKEALLQNLDALKENLSRQNLAMSGFNVSTGSSQAGQTFHEGRGAQHGQPQQTARQLADESGTDGEQVAYEYGDTREDALVDLRL